jgi:hypothetical protein
MATAVVFLDLNGWEMSDDLSGPMLDLMTDRITRQEFADILWRHFVPKGGVILKLLRDILDPK